MEIMNLGPSTGNPEPIPFPGVPGPDNMDYPKGAYYNGCYKPTKPGMFVGCDADKDRFFVSCCHYASVIYCALQATGRISEHAMDKFNVDGWNMEMIGAEHSPGFENTAGSLGQTISIAGGTAHARKMRGDTGKVFVMLGDGELQEGQTWEFVESAAFYKLDNMVIVSDYNCQQVEGATDNQTCVSNMADRFNAFGAKCVECNGHDIQAIIDACNVEHEGKPLVVLCKTSGTTMIPPLEKKKPFLHFVRIPKDSPDRAEYERIYEEL